MNRNAGSFFLTLSQKGVTNFKIFFNSDYIELNRYINILRNLTPKSTFEVFVNYILD